MSLNLVRELKTRSLVHVGLKTRSESERVDSRVPGR